MKDIFIHPTAIVETKDVGAKTRIWAYAHVMFGAGIGRECNIGDHCFIEGGVRIGDRVTVKNGNMLWEGVRLDDGVFVGPHVFFTNDLYPRSPRLPVAAWRYADKRRWLLSTHVKTGASLGAGAVILPGLTIGEYAMIGAGAVVCGDVAAHALVVGNPAVAKGWVCRCGNPIAEGNRRLFCHQCGLRYRRQGRGIRCDGRSP